MSKTIAILLTVFNRKLCTLKCLKQLTEQLLPEGVTCDVYITDGGSTDGTVESVKELYPEVNIQVKDGVFWNRGMYASWEWAASMKKYDFFLWLNDDTFLYNDCIKTLYEASAVKGDACIIVGPTVDTATQQRVTYGGRWKGKGIAPLNGELTAVDYFNGNIVLVPADVYQKLGNLDYYFTHSKGDFDYGMRARKAGIEIYQCGRALGECDLHERIDRWCDPEVPLRKRWAMLNRPNGMPPKETFHIDKRHRGFLVATFHYCTTIIRCLIPQLWVKFGKNERG